MGVDEGFLQKLLDFLLGKTDVPPKGMPKEKPSKKKKQESVEDIYQEYYPYIVRVAPELGMEVTELIPYWEKASKSVKETFASSYNFVSTVFAFKKLLNKRGVSRTKAVESAIHRLSLGTELKTLVDELL